MSKFEIYLQLLRLCQELADSTSVRVADLPDQPDRFNRQIIDAPFDDSVACLRRIVRFQFCILDEFARLPPQGPEADQRS